MANKTLQVIFACGCASKEIKEDDASLLHELKKYASNPCMDHVHLDGKCMTFEDAVRRLS